MRSHLNVNKWVVGVALACLSTAALAGWMRIKGDPSLTVMADAGSIRRSGDIVSMWSLINYVKPRKTDDGKEFLSSQQYFEYDCADKLSRRVEFNRYADLSGLGQLVYSNKTPGNWSSVASGSVGGELLRFACGEK
jgi:hypothetical protein